MTNIENTCNIFEVTNGPGKHNLYPRGAIDNLKVAIVPDHARDDIGVEMFG